MQKSDVSQIFMLLWLIASWVASSPILAIICCVFSTIWATLSIVQMYREYKEGLA